MHEQRARSIFIPGALLFAIIFIVPSAVTAQQNVLTLSGTVKDAAGATVQNAKVVVTNAITCQSMETQTDASGHYLVSIPSPGEYELSISAEGYSTNTTSVAGAAATNKTADVTSGGILSLGDLGFTPSQTQGSAQDQARLDKRSHMLKIHQRLGLIAAGQ